MTLPDWILEAAAEIAGLRAYNTEHFNYPEFQQQVAEVIAKHWQTENESDSGDSVKDGDLR